MNRNRVCLALPLAKTYHWGMHTVSELPSSCSDRDEIHFRNIEMRCFRRSDGWFEIEGRVTDRKPHDFSAGPGARFIPANAPAHDLGVRLVFDSDLVVRDVGTFSAAYPYRECPGGGATFQSLVGLRMSGGWTREVRSRLAGPASCTHLVELLTPMATAAYQAIAPLYPRLHEGVDAQGRPLKMDSCYAYRADGEIARQRWPELAIDGRRHRG